MTERVHRAEMTAADRKALALLKQDEGARIGEPPLYTRLEDKGFIVRSDRGWTVTDQAERQLREPPSEGSQ